MAPAVVPGSVLGRGGVVAPSERIILGGIGVGRRGGYVLSTMLPLPDVRFAAIADVRANRRVAVKAMAERGIVGSDFVFPTLGDRPLVAKAMAERGSSDNKCEMYRDFRDLLDRDDIDAVLIATSDRWHAHAAMMAAEAGKDVYVEKPCAMTIELTQRLADTFHRTGRVFQAGTQRRSISNFIHAIELAKSGKLGKLHAVHASIGGLADNRSWLPAQPLPDPEVCDWDMWLGPAPWRPFNQAYVDGRWGYYDDFSASFSLLGWGSHTLDLCQAANGADDTTPIEYERIGAPNNNTIACRYANGVTMIVRAAGWLGLGTCPVRFEGDEGWVETGDTGRIAVSLDSLRAELPAPTITGTSTQTHVRDFFNCVKSRGRTAANADVMRKSHIACHAAAIAWKLGRKLILDPVTEEFVGDEKANRMRSRAARQPWGSV
jgi:predicted dehydrogenase